MGTHLTERVVKAAEIGTRKYVVFDEDCAGFGLCVFLSGRKGYRSEQLQDIRRAEL